MSAGGRIVADWAVAPDLRAVEDRLAGMAGVEGMTAAASDGARMVVTLEEGADAPAILATLRAAAPGAMAEWQRPTGFGDSADLSARLLDLIRSGAKTATCGALRDYEAEGQPLPEPGRTMLALDWDGAPALTYRVTDVQVMPFAAVPDDFARAEGEGDPAEWRAAHEAFFARNGGFDPQMPVVCERFVLIEDLAAPQPAREVRG